MNSELYKLLMTYDGLDDEFINRAFEIIMEDEEELEDFIKDFDIVNDNEDVMGSYYFNDRRIVVNKDSILTGRNDIRNKKLLALKVLRHEIEHARNLKTLYEGRDDIESVIVRYGLENYARCNGLYPFTSFSQLDPFLAAFRRIENYPLNPGDRIANIRAWKYMVNLLKNQRKTEDLLTARANLYFAYTQGYNSNGWYLNPPTYEYLLNMRMMDEYRYLKKRVEEKQYVFGTRLQYGLPLIDGKEYDQKILQKVKLQKRKQPK